MKQTIQDKKIGELNTLAETKCVCEYRFHRTFRYLFRHWFLMKILKIERDFFGYFLDRQSYLQFQMAVHFSQFDHILNSPNTDLRTDWNVILFILDFDPLTNKFVDGNLIQTDCKIFLIF